jgi:hypothetical protein
MDESAVGVGDLAALYLGNILYAIERAAMTLEQEGKVADAAFYRGIARKLAEARGKERGKND